MWIRGLEVLLAADTSGWDRDHFANLSDVRNLKVDHATETGAQLLIETARPLR